MGNFGISGLEMDDQLWISRFFFFFVAVFVVLDKRVAKMDNQKTLLDYLDYTRILQYALLVILARKTLFIFI